MISRLLTYLVLITFVAGTHFSLFTRPGYACGVKEPETIIALYESSTSVVVAEFRGRIRGAELSRNDYYAEYRSTESYDVVETIVGDLVDRLTLDDTDYVPTRQESETPESEDQTDDDEVDVEDIDIYQGPKVRVGRSDLKDGEKVLLFLKKSEESDELLPTDYRDGFKRMPDDLLAKYVDMIKRLDALYSSEAPDMSRIVDWLVETARDPDTRWEAAYTLQNSYEYYDRYLEIKKRSDDGDKEATEQLGEWFGDAKAIERHLLNYARLLTDQHKNDLTDLVIQTPEDGPKKLIPGDHELLSIVSRWGRSDVTSAMIGMIRSDEIKGWRLGTLMSLIAKGLADDELDEIVESYLENGYQPDKDVVSDEDVDADIAAADEDKDTGPTKGDIPKPDPKETGDRESSDDDAGTVETPKPTITYGELRAELKAKFLSRAELLLLMRQ